MKNILILLSFVVLSQILIAQNPKWNKIQDNSISLNQNWSSVKSFQQFHIDLNSFRSYLMQNAPVENHESKFLKIELPSYDGKMHTFYIMESPVMESELQAKYSEIKTYKGTDGFNYMRMIVTPHWIKVYVLTEHGDIVIEPINSKSSDYYGVYHSSDILLPENSVARFCGERGHDLIRHEMQEKGYKINSNISSTILDSNQLPLITFRVAIACTGEFGQNGNLGGGTIASALAKMADALTYANAIYEKDFSIHLNLVNNNDRIIFLDPEKDPYDNNGEGRFLLGQNPSIVNARITLLAFDVGHVFNAACSDVGGVAILGSVCTDGKAAGVTCWYTAAVDYVSQRIFCHEMGHQFSASHTFSNCNGNESGTQFEPGGGNTIMSYNGLCGGLNVSSRSGDLPHPNYFHSCSIEQVYQFTRNFATCGTKSEIGNSTPVPNILTPNNIVLPILTPFELKGNATDSEDTTLTYVWEQYDNGPYGSSIGEVTPKGPLFRSLFPSKDSSRVLPWWGAILNPMQNMANYDKAEVLPSVSRELNFRFTVRDNHSGGGATAFKSLKINVTDQAGPFSVTFPNTLTDRLFKNACNKITWNVANTYNLPVNCKKVNIYLFKQNEYDKLILLKENTDNDGVELVDIPDLGNNARVRIMVKSADHIFFDISDRTALIIDANSVGVNMGVTPNVVNICLPQFVEVKVKSCSFGGYKGDLKLFIESGLPQGSSYRFEKSSISESDETKLIVDANNLTTKNTFTLIVAGITQAGDTLRDFLVINAIKNDFSDQVLLVPANGARGVTETPVFRWKKSINANVYLFEIATTPSFGNSTVYSQNNVTADTLLLPVLLKESSIYYWRIIPLNDCGSGNSTLTYALQTVNKTCSEQSYTGNPVGMFPNRTYNIKIPVDYSGIVSDINLNHVEVDADAVNAVRMYLLSPSGTRVNLFNAQCGVLLNFRCNFDDEAPIPVKCPPTGDVRMQPFEPLSKFKNENLKGDWSFEIITTKDLRDGQILNFNLQYCAELSVTNPYNLVNEALRLNIGDTKNISNSLLLSQDSDNTASELMYTLVNNPVHGNLLLNGIVLNVGNTFFQKDIDDLKLSYQHTGSNSEIDGFYFTVNDGQNGWYGVNLFTIYIGAVATKDLLKQEQFEIYPNPGTGIFQLLTHDREFNNSEIIVQTLNGKTVHQTRISNLKDPILDLSNLQDGVYLISLRNKNSFSTKKLVLSRD